MKFIDYPRSKQRKKNSLDDLVFSTRLRIARNLEGVPFPVILDENKKNQISEKICSILQSFEESMIIESIHQMDRQKLIVYASSNVVTNEFIQNGQTFIAESHGDWVLLINETDHLKILSLETGYNASVIYKRLDKIMSRIGKKIDFAFDEDFGFLTSSFLNVGTGLRISVLINLYGLVVSKQIEPFIKVAKQTGFSVVNIEGEESESSLFLIHNISSLGLSEARMVQDMENFLNLTWKEERRAREQYFMNYANLEVCYEEIFELKQADTLSWKDLLYYIAMLDAMNRIMLSIPHIKSFRNMIYQTMDENLLYRYDMDKEEAGKYRLKMFLEKFAKVKFMNKAYHIKKNGSAE